LEGSVLKLEGVKGNKLKEGQGGLRRKEEYVMWRKGERRRMNV
jgi:hypothetical protein